MLEAKLYEEELAMAEATLILVAAGMAPAGSPTSMLAEIILRAALRGKCLGCEEKCGLYSEEAIMGSVADEAREMMMNEAIYTEPVGAEN